MAFPASGQRRPMVARCLSAVFPDLDADGWCHLEKGYGLRTKAFIEKAKEELNLVSTESFEVGGSDDKDIANETTKPFNANFANGKATITEDKGNLIIEHDRLKGIEIDAKNIPDMVPALAVTAALADGITVIKGAERLRIKECDRLAAMADGLSKLGADISETKDGLIIKGVKFLHGGEVKGYNDHRIVMSMAAAGICADGDVIISDRESISKSYPKFFEDYKKLGGVADVIMGE